jgi:hypothetical protein
MASGQKLQYCQTMMAGRSPVKLLLIRQSNADFVQALGEVRSLLCAPNDNGRHCRSCSDGRLVQCQFPTISQNRNPDMLAGDALEIACPRGTGKGTMMRQLITSSM